MNEKYSTKELIYFLEGSYAETPPGMMEIVYAKLRAADKLCEAARKSVDNCPCNFGGLDEEGRPFGKQPCDECDPLRKAIADYEEGK
jgi:hypothetical protein